MKSWTPNGTIQTVSYKPVLDNNHENETNIPKVDLNSLNEDVKALRADISGGLNELFGKIEQLEKSIAVPTGNQGNLKDKRRQHNESNADDAGV